MSTDLWYENGAAALVGIINELYQHGDCVTPRGQPTLELKNVTVTIQEPEHCLMTGIGRRMNTKLAAVEALQLLGGCSYPELLVGVAPNTRAFLDHGSFSGAYGPRIREQMPKIIRRLRDDPETRQAVVMIWDPKIDLLPGLHDYPCTLSFTFTIRDNKLRMSTHMRSNDIWWGWTYDAFQFTQLQLSVANILGLKAGPYTHYVDSLHVYERDHAEIMAFMEKAPNTYMSKPLHGLGRLGDDWAAVQQTARLLMTVAPDSQEYPTRGGSPKTFSWYKDLELHSSPRVVLI